MAEPVEAICPFAVWRKKKRRMGRNDHNGRCPESKSMKGQKRGFVKELFKSSKELFKSSKELFESSKELFKSLKELFKSSKELFKSSKERNGRCVYASKRERACLGLGRP